MLLRHQQPAGGVLVRHAARPPHRPRGRAPRRGRERHLGRPFHAPAFTLRPVLRRALGVASCAHHPTDGVAAALQQHSAAGHLPAAEPEDCPEEVRGVPEPHVPGRAPPGGRVLARAAWEAAARLPRGPVALLPARQHARHRRLPRGPTAGGIGGAQRAVRHPAPPHHRRPPPRPQGPQPPPGALRPLPDPRPGAGATSARPPGRTGPPCARTSPFTSASAIFAHGAAPPAGTG